MKIINKVALCMSFATFAFMASFADTEVVDGITWTYTVSNGKASVGSGSYSGSTAVPKSTTGAITIPSSLGGNPVASIWSSAFSGCSGLTSVTIPDSVTRIGDYAFYGCSGLTTFVVGDGNPNYKSVNGLLLSKDGKLLVAGVNGVVTIPDGVTSIGIYAFDNCSGLTSVTIPDSVTSIGDYAFYYCTNLRSVTIPDSVTSIGYYAFFECRGLTSLTIPDSVMSIGQGAFNGCSGLASVKISDGVTSIGMYSFAACKSLTSVTIPDSVTNAIGCVFAGSGVRFMKFGKGLGFLDSGMFDSDGLRGTVPEIIVFAGDAPDGGELDGRGSCRCYVSRNSVGWGVDIPGTWRGMSIEYIDEPVFTVQNGVLTDVDLRGTTDVTIPDYVTSIGPGAFSNRIELLSVTIPNSVTNIAESAFWGCISLSDITVPNSVQSIGNAAFSGCIGLRSVTIQSPGIFVASGAFSGCINVCEATVPGSKCGIPFDNVTNLIISAGTTSIANYAFSGCSGLKSVTIPDSVTSVAQFAFDGCNELLFDTSTIPGVKLVDGWIVGATELLSGSLDLSGARGIGQSAFYECDGITSVTIPGSVMSIGDLAFYNCTNLTSVAIGDGVTSIGEFAFRNCDGLTSIAIPDSVTSIGAGIYDGCTTLWKKWYKALEEVSQESALPPPIPDPAYAITNIVADRAIASVTVDSDCAIDEFVLKDGKVYDCVLYISNTADEEVTLTLPSGNEYKAFKGARPLIIPANSQHIITITRVADRTFLVSREELETLQ